MKPAYRSEHHAETFKFLAEQEQHTFLPKLSRSLITSRYNPEVSMSSKTHMLMDEVIEEEQPLIIVANHVQKADHHVMSAAIRDIPELDEFVFCKSIALAKSRYYIFGPSAFVYYNLNCWPVSRPQDIKNEKGTTADAGKAFISLVKAAEQKIDQNIHIAGFPEGTRNKGDWRQLQKIESGFGYLTARNVMRHQEARKSLENKVANKEHITDEDRLRAKRISMLILSIAYASKTRKDKFNPVVRFNILPERPDSSKMYSFEMEKLMQDGLDTAYKIMDSRSKSTN